MPCSLILASGSEYKRSLLGRLGLSFETRAASIDEESRPGETPGETARRLASAKADEVSATHPDSFVLGADQVISLDGQRLRTPGGRSAAKVQLQRLQGRCHDLICSVALTTPHGEHYIESVAFEMHMRSLSEAAIEQYLDADEPYDCVGAYKIESAGIRLFRALRGDDYTAIIGLPLTRVWNILETAGYFTDAESGPPRR
jgi:septum formation protein